MNIVESIGAEIRARGFKKVALFGTRYTVETRMFGMLEGVEVVVPDQIDAIHTAYMQAVDGSDAGRPVLSRIAHELPVDAIVLAGTDLAVIFNESNLDFPHVDGAQVHIQAILREIRPATATAH